MNKIFILVSLAALCFVVSICGAENQKDALSSEKKIDEIDTKTDEINDKIDDVYELQKKMYKESKNEPLANKKYGVELNILRILIIKKAMTLSGGGSLFNITRQAEIAFPIYYGRPSDTLDLNSFTADCHYRYFLGNTQNGFYLSGFARYAYLSGYFGDNHIHLFDTLMVNKKSTANKIGIGIGVGYRKFSYKGLFWGTSLSFGRYFIGDNDKFYGSFLSYDDDSEYIIDFEFLKFGWAF